jgi:hypothetical protein
VRPSSLGPHACVFYLFLLFKEANPYLFLKNKRIIRRHVACCGRQCVVYQPRFLVTPVVVEKSRPWVFHIKNLFSNSFQPQNHPINTFKTSRNQLIKPNKSKNGLNHKIKSEKIFHPWSRFDFLGYIKALNNHYKTPFT